jgi:hypothetical protein
MRMMSRDCEEPDSFPEVLGRDATLVVPE